MKNWRQFISTIFTFLLLSNSLWAQAQQQQQHSFVFVNQLGFTPKAPKFFVVTSPSTNEFQIITRSRDPKVVYTGKLSHVDADLSDAWVGDFSAVQDEGCYHILVGGEAVAPGRLVTIYSDIYKNPLQTLFHYYPVQRCGDSDTGWHTPCHTNDAKRVDNGEHVDVAGGWHQSCDLRKWTFGTVFGLMGLSELELIQKPRWGLGQIEDELRWGNKFFQHMVQTNGAVMDHVVVPLGWGAERDLYANDAPLTTAFNVMTGEAMTARVFKDKDPAYSKQCLAVAERIWKHLTSPNYPTTKYNPPVVPKYHEWLPGFFSQTYSGSALGEGSALLAATAMYRATMQTNWLNEAALRATALTKLQVGGDVEKDLAAACFHEGPGKTTFACASYDGWFGPIGLCEIVQLMPNHPDAPLWRAAVERIVKQQLTIARRNAWGLIASYWYSENPGGGRGAGTGFYRYFYPNPPIGVNQEILAAALFLLRAKEITGDPFCAAIAQRQVDFVLGANPAMASTVEGLGRNQPERLVNVGEFFPPVPQIPGAVMTGMCGDQLDNPMPFTPGLQCEYDMPSNALLMWVMSELAQVK